MPSAWFPGVGYSQVSMKNTELRDRHRGDPFWSVAFMVRLYGTPWKDEDVNLA